MANERTDRPPSQFPDVTPPRYPLTDYSFTLQAVMELQKTIGGLTEAVNTLKAQSEKQGTKLDSISHRVYAATVVVTIAVPVLAFLATWLAPIITAALRLSPAK